MNNKHTVVLRREQLTFNVGSSHKADIEFEIKVLPSLEVIQWLKDNIDKTKVSIEEKTVNLITIHEVKNIVDNLTSLEVYFDEIEDAIRFKLEC